MNKFAVSITAIITERDFKSEYLFRMCSVVTNLVTSLEFQPIRCATTLCHFGWLRDDGYVATQFILFSGTGGEQCYKRLRSRSGTPRSE